MSPTSWHLTSTREDGQQSTKYTVDVDYMPNKCCEIKTIRLHASGGSGVTRDSGRVLLDSGKRAERKEEEGLTRVFTVWLIHKAEKLEAHKCLLNKKLLYIKKLFGAHPHGRLLEIH